MTQLKIEPANWNKAFLHSPQPERESKTNFGWFVYHYPKIVRYHTYDDTFLGWIQTINRFNRI